MSAPPDALPLPRMPGFRLDGRRALVTGAAGGIGFAIACALAEAGAAVTLCGRTASTLERAGNALVEAGHSATWSVLDITDAVAVEAFAGDREPFDVVVNNAGQGGAAALPDITDEHYSRIMDVNVRGTTLVTRATTGRLIDAGKPGSVIHISSMFGQVGMADRSIYIASKHAVEGLTKAMALELAPHRIRVNAICPTYIETPLTQKSLADPAFRERLERSIPLGRIGEPADVMGAAVFLASDAAAMVTGTSLLIDGGCTAA